MNLISKTPLRAYLCDLTHDTITLISDTIPINIGFVAAYAKKKYGADVEVSLFKYTTTIIQALKEKPPDIIALSNYSWNSNLSEAIAGFAKECNPNVITVQGGTNFPHRASLQKVFLLQRPNTDFYIELEGEIAFSNLVGRLLDLRDGKGTLYDTPLPGCIFIEPSTRKSKNPVLVTALGPPRIRTLDDIPSPYLSGILDHFFDGRLTPFLETNRGCPFLCTFCHTGNEYFNKINFFSIERIAEEINYIAPRVARYGIVNLHIADTNFGMYPINEKICELLLESQKKYHWPRQIMATTGKNNKERIIEITQMMGNAFAVNMSVQSMSPVVLKNIKRSNIKLDHYMAINHTLNERGRATKGELIIGLPGETKDSFVHGMEQVINAGTSNLCTYSLMLLQGTPFKEPEYREQFKIQGKYRVVPLNFGEYAGKRIFDIEEVGIANKDMSFDDYLWLRGLSLMIEIMHNSQPFHELFLYVNSFGITLFDFILHVYRRLDHAPISIQNILKDFLAETRNELWNSEEELIEHYQKDEAYHKLLKGEVGGNLIYKYKALSLSSYSKDWAQFIQQVCKEITPAPFESFNEEIELLGQFIQYKLSGLLNATQDTSPRTMESFYDILQWRKNIQRLPLRHFKLAVPIVYSFLYTKEQIADRDDLFKRYGSHVNGLSKIVTRVSDVKNLFRKIITLNQKRDEVSPEETDMFIRYSLSN